MTKKIFKIAGMHCTSCSLLIDGEIEDLGAKSSCSYAKSEVEVEWDPAKVSEIQIVQAVGKAGYKVVA
jgi:copper chaperone CopZ